MKYIIITAFAVVSMAACNNRNHSVRTETMNDDNTSMKIVDDSKTLSIKVKTRNKENPIDYKESFDVRAMNEEQKKELKKRILDSLGVNEIK